MSRGNYGGGRPLIVTPDLDRSSLDDYGLEPADGCGRPNSPLWMAEWCYYQAVMDTGHYLGPLERLELSGRIEQDSRLRHIRTQVDAFASRLAARVNPGAWAAREQNGGRRVAIYHCGDCGDAVSRRKNMPPDTDGVIRCGRCKHHRERYGAIRPGALESKTMRATA